MIRDRRVVAMREGSRPGFAILDSGLSRRSTVMRLGAGQPEQPAYSRVIRRRSALPGPSPLTPESDADFRSPHPSPRGALTRDRSIAAMREGSRPGFAILDSGLSRRSTVMRLGAGQPEQPAYSRVIRRRSALPGPSPLTPESDADFRS